MPTQPNRQTRRALQSMGIPPQLAQVESPDQFGRAAMGAMLAAVRGDCKCKPCRLLRRAADGMEADIDDEEDTDA